MLIYVEVSIRNSQETRKRSMGRAVKDDISRKKNPGDCKWASGEGRQGAEGEERATGNQPILNQH